MAIDYKNVRFCKYCKQYAGMSETEAEQHMASCKLNPSNFKIGNKYYKGFSHTSCEHYPCHKNVSITHFNCLFCYCPLYHKMNCGGNFTIKEGIKDCSKCTYPHDICNYDEIISKI